MSASGADLVEPLRRHLDSTQLLPPGTHVLAAVSGGLDSVVMLHLLRFHVPDITITVAHFDHGMRADSSADAFWVRGLCTAWDTPCEHARAGTAPRSEAAARELRYAFLHAIEERAGAHAIATAHHADDQAETVLFRLARGTGIAGLAGIPARRGTIVRPLLPFTRAQLHAYAQRARIRWRVDPTNRQLHFARNRIRHVVLPALEAVRPGAARHIAALAARVAQSERAWREVLDGLSGDVVLTRTHDGLVLARDRLLAYHPPVRARVIRHLLGDLGSRPDRGGTRVAVEFIRAGRSGGRVELGGGIMLERELDTMRLYRVGEPLPDEPLVIGSTAADAGSFTAGGQRYAARWRPTEVTAHTADTVSFDPSALRFPLVLRAWRAGDRIRLDYGSKKLKKLFLERRVGRGRRARTAVLADAAGAVLWVVGHERSVLARPRHDMHVFEIRVVDGDTV